MRPFPHFILLHKTAGKVTVGLKSDLICEKRGRFPLAAELDLSEHGDLIREEPLQTPHLLFPTLASALTVKLSYSRCF